MTTATSSISAPMRIGRTVWLLPVTLAALQVWLIFHHSPWRDEIQARLLAEQPLPKLFELLHYEGHPALWYLVLKLSGLIVGPQLSLPALQAAIALTTLTLVWARSPFAWPVKLLVSASYFVSYEYGVIARSYGLGVVLFLAFVILRRSRWAWLVLALLANVAVHTAILAGIGALWLLQERRWSWAGAFVLFVGCVLCLATIWPAPDAVRAAPLTSNRVFSLLVATTWASSLIMPAPLDGRAAVWGWVPHGWWAVGVGLAALVVVSLAVGRRRRDVILLGLMFAALFALSAFVYLSFPRHFGLAAVLAIGLLWAQAEDGLQMPGVAYAWLAATALGGAVFLATAVNVPFSRSDRVAEWIRGRHLQGAAWAAWRPYNGLDITGPLGVPTFNLIKGCWNTYQRWDYNPEAKYPAGYLDKRLEEFASATGGGYLLSDQLILTSPDLRVAAWLPKGMFAQAYYLYEVKSRDPRRRPLPTCR